MEVNPQKDVVEGESDRKRKLSDTLDHDAVDGRAEKIIKHLEDKSANDESALVTKEGGDLGIDLGSKSKIFETLDGFQVKGVLSNSADCKRVIIEGTVDEQTAIVILDKKPFTAEILPELFSRGSSLKHTFQNDIYGSYDCFPTAKGGEIKATIVYPATQKHIDKYIHHSLYLVDETPKIYTEVTLPYLEKSSFSLKWVFNILEHKQEADRIVFEDSDPETGFILLPDLKWDGKASENLYLTAIVHAKEIKSLRNLTAKHLPLLTNILENGTKAIFKKYGLKRAQLRVYIHYQPSYYHLHVHFTSLQFNAPGIYTEKSHLLQTVIDNITAYPSFYQDATLPFVVKENENLYNDLTKYGYTF